MPDISNICAQRGVCLISVRQEQEAGWKARSSEGLTKHWTWLKGSCAGELQRKLQQNWKGEPRARSRKIWSQSGWGEARRCPKRKGQRPMATAGPWKHNQAPATIRSWCFWNWSGCSWSHKEIRHGGSQFLSFPVFPWFSLAFPHPRLCSPLWL